jgi:hypothetical protein
MFDTPDFFADFFADNPSPLRGVTQALRGQSLHHLESLLADRLDPALLAPNPTAVNSRERIYTPKLTFLSFLDQTLNPGASCREAVRQVRAFYQTLSQPKDVRSDVSPYCQARARWSLAELVEIREYLADRQGRPPMPWTLPQPRRLKVVDGTSMNLPDTPANRLAYPQSKRQQPECGFPLMRAVALFELAGGQLLERAYGPESKSEQALLQELWPTLCQDDLLIGDRNFGSWSALAGLPLLGADGLFRLHASRNADFRQGQRLGPNERLVSWAKPIRRAANCTAQQWAALPAQITVRLVRFRVPTIHGRSKKIVLVTTLLDPLLWPAQLLAQLYAWRWKIELYFDDLKTTLGLDMLSCLSPDMVHKELEMHLVAYNLIRSLMAEAACVCHAPLERLSFKGTLDTARQYSRQIAQIPPSKRKLRRRLYLDMLSVIALDLVPERPDRFEPRCLKRRPKAYAFMKRPRRELRAAQVDHLPARPKSCKPRA